MSYFLLKIIHIVSASMLVGILLMSVIYSYAFTQFTTGRPFRLAFSKRHRFEIPLVLLSLVLQPITGLWIITIQHYNPLSLWVIGTLLLYPILGCLWLVMLFMQQRCLMLDKAHAIRRLQRGRLMMLAPTIGVLFLLYFLMVNRPERLASPLF